MNVRLKTLQKIAQTAEKKEVAGEPRAVSISMFPTVNLGWGANNLSLIQKMIDTINITLYQLSNGKIDFDKMRQQNFNVDLSAYHTATKGVVSLSKIIYQQILTNNGDNYEKPLSAEEKKKRVDGIKGSIQTSTIPDGGITVSLPTKIGGNFKTLILNLLSNIH